MVRPWVGGLDEVSVMISVLELVPSRQVLRDMDIFADRRHNTAKTRRVLKLQKPS